MTGILALDLGTRTGYAIRENGRVESGVQVFDVKRGESPGMRYRRFTVWLTDMLTTSLGGGDNELERAWGAGFFDGEGYIGCSPNGCQYTKKDGTVSAYDTKGLGIGINQAGSPELLQRFRAAVGDLGVVNGPYIDSRFEDAREYWHHAVSSLDRCRDVVAAIWPWLGSRKREQAEAAIGEKLVNLKRPPSLRSNWLIVYEAPHHRGGAATEVAAGFATRVQEIAARFSLDHTAVHTATLKKRTTGKGNAKKPEMLAAVRERFGYQGVDEDEADALALLAYASTELLSELQTASPLRAASRA